MRVLLIAEACHPEQVSIPLEGWSLASAIAAQTDAHLVTQIRNEAPIRRQGWTDDQFTVIDTERVARAVYRVARTLRGSPDRAWTTLTALIAISSLWFEHQVWKRFGPRLRAGQFDVVHRITPISPTTPCFLARACAHAGVPFVAGPLNGGLAWPRSFQSARWREREWLSYLRAAHRLLPGYRALRRHAAALVIGSSDTWRQMPARYHGRCVYIPENAVDHTRFALAIQRPPAAPLRVAFVGRLVPYKGADMLLDAAAPLVRNQRIVLDIIGDGPEMSRLTHQARQLGLATGLRLDGWVPHPDLPARLIQSDVFAFPSIREFGGAVVLEAMALGLAPIVVAYGGPADLVTERTGIRLTLAPRPQLVDQLHRALRTLADNPALARQFGQRARQRALRQFTWAAKARQVLDVYHWVTGRRRDKPDFGMPLPDPPGSLSAQPQLASPGPLSDVA